MRIKEAAKRTGLTEKTIRYYEECGLVVPHKELRYDRLWRDYSEEHIRLLSAVAALRRSSFRVEEIALLLSEPERIPETVENVRERAEITRREAEKLCTLLARPELREAPDVLALARRLEAAVPVPEEAAPSPGKRLPALWREYRKRRESRGAPPAGQPKVRAALVRAHGRRGRLSAKQVLLLCAACLKWTLVAAGVGMLLFPTVFLIWLYFVPVF